MKRLLSAVLAVVTAALPSVSAAVEIAPSANIIPEGRRNGSLPLTEGFRIPVVDLQALPANLQIPSVDVSLTLPVAPALVSAEAQAAAAPTAAVAQALSARAQATAALPTAAESAKGTASVRERSERIFSGARSASGGDNDLSSGEVSAVSSEGSSGPELGAPTDRGPPSRKEPPSSGGGSGGEGRKGPSKKLISALALATVVAVLAFTPASAGAIDTLAGQAHVVADDFAHHGPALGIISAVAALGYDFSNVVGFVYPLTQVHALFKARSGKVSMAQQITGLGASLLLAFNMFYLNHPGASTLFSAYQNLFGGLTFGVILGQMLYYNKRPGKEGEGPSGLKVMLQTAAVIVGVALVSAAAGMGLTADLPLLHVAPLIVPFQMVLGFGFAYLTLPGYLKIQREKSVGAASFGTTAMFFLANSCLVVWALYRMATLPGVAIAPAMTAVAVFAAVATLASQIAFRWLGSLKWNWIPENLKIWGRTVTKNSLIDLAAFVAVSAFMTALVGAGYGILRGVVDIPLAQHRDFLTFLFYLVDVILASTSAVLTMRAFRKYKKSGKEGA